MVSQLVKFASLLAIVGLATADCTLQNIMEEEREAETRTELCETQDEGRWNFAMDVSEVVVPSFNGGSPWAGLVGNKAFIVYDHDCVPQGVYSPGNEGNDCGTPYWIEEDWLPYDIKIKNVFMQVGGGDFTFSYADGDYMPDENDGSCSSLSEGLRGEEACRCSFPLEGQPDKKKMVREYTV